MTDDDLLTARLSAELCLAMTDRFEKRNPDLKIDWKREAVASSRTMIRVLDHFGVPQGEPTTKGNA